ncbi:MAG: 3-hydroxyanthranilate 3,4-dioxygenase [Ignavibacteriae bacterium]|nr:3-hydroxyanthranilate 3,4-dioxygenase [Ignavibacteriota bacterium]MCB9244698.1 3-hydroxyanthranilate 3,4-dioxygenase [Ignavibacteriales bacterium]
MSAPFNFMKWIEENRHLLKPPVGNKCMVDEDFIVMVVGGPNTRKDYHYEEGPEFFYQIEGDITVKVIENGEPKDINIKEGEMYYLPPRVPHSPQRSEGSIGIVIERKRVDGEMDGLMWYCENCGNKLYEEYFQLENIVDQLPPIMNKFYADEEKRTCSNCGTVMEPPVKK